jgi:hypothetical protein
MKLNVGVSKKLGLPAYSSVGASCNVEVELDPDSLADPAGFRARVGAAFGAARRAVDDELARLLAEPGSGKAIEPGPATGHRHNVQVFSGDPPAKPAKTEARRGGPIRLATPGQVRAIVAIARRQKADLNGLLRDLGVTRAEDLSLAAASRLIDQLKAASDA